MKQYYPIIKRPLGNNPRVRQLQAFGNAQMDILENQMLFQGLKQGTRRVSIPGGGFIVCRKCFNIKTVDIYLPSVEVKEQYKKIQSQIDFLSLIMGYPEEKIIFQYTDTNEQFFIEDGDAVFCDDNGSGIYTFVSINVMYGQFTKCFSSSIMTSESNGATALVTTCLEEVFNRLYNVEELFHNDIQKLNNSLLFNISTVSAYDVYPITDVDCYNNPHVEGVWSKTYDDMIVTAYSFLPTVESTFYVWQVTVSYKDKLLKWGLNGRTASSLFSRQTCVGQYCSTKRRSHIGFDVWAIENAEGEKEYYIGLIGEQEASLSQWRYTTDNDYLEADWGISLDKTVIGSSPWVPEGSSLGEAAVVKRTLRLIGYGFDEIERKHLVYWTIFGGTIYSEDKISLNKIVNTTYYDKNDSNGNLMQIKNALWNPIIKEPFFVWESVGEQSLGPYGYSTPVILDQNMIIRSGTNIECLLCSNSSTNIEYEFQGMTFNISMPTIILPEIFNPLYGYRAESSGKLYAGERFDRGGYYLDDMELNKGQRFASVSVGVSVMSYISGSDPLNRVDYVYGTYGLGDECIPTDMYDYSFIGGIFNVDGFNFEYLSTPYEKKVIDENSIACVKSDESTEHFIGKQNLMDSISYTFPYDDTWRSILLHGYCRDNKHTVKAEREIKSYVVYAERESKELFMVDRFGTRHDLSDQENYSRAFFKQQHVTIDEEV